MHIEEHDAAATREFIAPLFAAVYPKEILENIVWRNVTSAKAERRVVGTDSAGNPIAAASMLFRDAQVDGKPVRIGGIGGVMTLPVLQGQGLGKAVMLRAHDILMRDDQVAFGLLFCEPKNVRFYEKLEWVTFTGTVIVEQPSGIGSYSIMSCMVRDLRSSAPQSGTIDLCGLPW